MPKLALILVSAGVLFAAEPAGAVTCGQIDPDTDAVAKGVLVLDEDDSVITLAFGRDTGTRRLNLVFNVTGCEIDPNTQEPPSIDVRPTPGDSEQLDRAILNSESPDTDGTTFEQVFTVNTDAFDPGSYTGVLLLDAPYLARNRTPLAVSRSEDTEWIPIGLGALGGLVGAIWFLALKFVCRNKLAIRNGWLVVVIPLAIGAGAWAVLNGYWDQDVWTTEDNWPAALKAGFTGASTGSAAGLLAAIFLSPAASGVGQQGEGARAAPTAT
jgi:hypothetical protein